MTESIPATIFPEPTDSEWLFISDSPTFTRTVIRHALDTDQSSHFGLTEALVRKLRRDRLTASRLQQLVDKGTATVTKLDTDQIETVVITDDELRIATPGVADPTDHPALTVDAANQAADITAAYEQRVAAGTPVAEPFADVGWQDVLAAAANTFDDSFRETLAAATATDVTEPQRGASPLVEILCVVAAAQECTQKALTQFVEAQGLASPGTVTNTANELEEAGLIEREPVSVDRPGRPPKRLLLADKTLEPAEYVAHLPR